MVHPKRDLKKLPRPKSSLLAAIRASRKPGANLDALSDHLSAHQISLIRHQHARIRAINLVARYLAGGLLSEPWDDPDVRTHVLGVVATLETILAAAPRGSIEHIPPVARRACVVAQAARLRVVWKMAGRNRDLFRFMAAFV